MATEIMPQGVGAVPDIQTPKLYCKNVSSSEISCLNQSSVLVTSRLPKPDSLSIPSSEVESKGQEPNTMQNESVEPATSNKISMELSENKMVLECSVDVKTKVMEHGAADRSLKPSSTVHKDEDVANANGSGRLIKRSETGERGISSRYRPSSSSDVSDESSYDGGVGLLDLVLLFTGEGDSGGVGSAVATVVTSLLSQIILTSQYSVLHGVDINPLEFCSCNFATDPNPNCIVTNQDEHHELVVGAKSDESMRLLTWRGDGGDHGEDVHEVDEGPRLGEPPQRPRQRRHARPALADRHVHVVGGGGCATAALCVRRGGGGAMPRPFLRLQLLDLPRAAAAAVVVIARQLTAAVLGCCLGHVVARLGVTTGATRRS
ncbi:hypothetical protein EJB05_45193, partial [Eragrostis curvula]